MSSDDNRRIYFDITLKSLVKITQQASGICNIDRIKENRARNLLWATLPTALIELSTNMDFYKRIFSEWRDARQAFIAISAKVCFDMSPAEDTWKLNTVGTKPRTTIPLGSEEMPRKFFGPYNCSKFQDVDMANQLTNLINRKSEDGVAIELTNNDMFEKFATSKGMDRFAKPAQQWASDFESCIEENIATLAGSLSTKFILPAGNVFEFKSLNTDSEGPVYSLIPYKTPTKISKVPGAQ